MPWMPEESLPTASMGLAAAVCGAPVYEYGEWVYAIGGLNSNLLNAVAGYDTVQETWSGLPSMPTPRNGLAVAASPGLLHALGGFGITTPLTTHEVYDPANNAWSQAAPLPTPRAAFAAVTGPDGKIYAIAGFDGNGPVATVDAYDPVADKWTNKASMHTARTWLAAIAGHDGQIYALGGGNPTPLNSVEVFNPTADTWTISPHPLPAATCGLAAAVDPNGLIYAIGGDIVVNNNPVASPNVYSYNPAAPGWTSQPGLSSARGALAATTGPDGLIYAIGGTDGANELATVEAYTTDKCYPIEHKIAVLEYNMSNLEGDIPELPPQAQAGARKQLATLAEEMKYLQAQLKTCRGG